MSEDYEQNKNFEIFNVGTGKPYSVLEIIKSYEKVNNLKFKIEYKKSSRRCCNLCR